MSPEAYSWEVREAAEELYIVEGLTYEQVAEQTGVSLSQLKRWGVERDPSWSDRRREYRQAQTSIRRGVMLAKAKLIASVIDSEDPMKAFAFNSLVKSGQVIEAEARAVAAPPNATAPTPENPEELAIASLADAVAALQRAVQGKISAMLTKPDSLSFAAIKDTKAALEMIEQLQSKYAPTIEETTDKGGLSDDAAELIRRQILGLKN